MNPEQILTSLRQFKSNGKKQEDVIFFAACLIEDQANTIRRQRKQLADLNAKHNEQTK